MLLTALGLDTSEPLGGVAVYQRDGLAEERWMDRSLRHAECLFPLIDRVLHDCGLSGKAIDRVCVNRGPGSFTGLRIGIAAAKGLCQAWGVPLIGVDGTDAFRARMPGAQRLCVVLSSRRDLFYVRWFAGSHPKGPTVTMQESQLIDRLIAERRDVTLVGSGAPRVCDKLSREPHIHLAADALHRASPLWIARVGYDETTTDGLYAVEPYYVEPLLV
jgi:tRNA threonylcarbamoyladenosine biosynthesis protein TsaB